MDFVIVLMSTVLNLAIPFFIYYLTKIWKLYKRDTLLFTNDAKKYRLENIVVYNYFKMFIFFFITTLLLLTKINKINYIFIKASGLIGIVLSPNSLLCISMTLFKLLGLYFIVMVFVYFLSCYLKVDLTPVSFVITEINKLNNNSIIKLLFVVIAFFVSFQIITGVGLLNKLVLLEAKHLNISYNLYRKILGFLYAIIGIILYLFSFKKMNLKLDNDYFLEISLCNDDVIHCHYKNVSFSRNYLEIYNHEKECSSYTILNKSQIVSIKYIKESGD